MLTRHLPEQTDTSSQAKFEEIYRALLAVLRADPDRRVYVIVDGLEKIKQAGKVEKVGQADRQFGECGSGRQAR